MRLGCDGNGTAHQRLESNVLMKAKEMKVGTKEEEQKRGGGNDRNGRKELFELKLQNLGSHLVPVVTNYTSSLNFHSIHVNKIHIKSCNTIT